MNVNLLVQIKEVHVKSSKLDKRVARIYQLFPAKGGISQDQNLAFLGSGLGFHAKHLYQKDGSRFKTIYTKVLGPYDIVKRIDRAYPGQKIIWTESRRENPEELLRTAQAGEGEEWVYACYITHAFLNGFRCFPIVINFTRKTCYHLSALFPDYIPEDDLGVLVEDTYDLTLDKLGTPIDVWYLANKRMCACCGVVSDVTQPRKFPWVFPKKLRRA